MGVYIDGLDMPKKHSLWMVIHPNGQVWMRERHYCQNLEGIEATELDLVRCGECKHRPIKDDPDGENYGFNIIEPTDGDDICPCLVGDGWYSWMPEDNFYCGRGERRADEHTDKRD